MLALGWTQGIGLYVSTVAIVLGSITLGVYFGRRRRRQDAGEGRGALDSVVASVLGLLAFILAFTFGIAANRFDARKQVLLDDVNAIRVVARRATLLPAPYAAEVRALLVRYVDLRLGVRPGISPEELAAKLAETKRIQDDLWKHTLVLRELGYDTDFGALFVEGVNDLMDAHTRRATIALVYRIPTRIWYGLLVVTICGMFLVGYQFGLAGRNNLGVQFVLAVGFASVVALIADLDRADGAVRVSQQPMLELQRELAATP